MQTAMESATQTKLRAVPILIHATTTALLLMMTDHASFQVVYTQMPVTTILWQVVMMEAASTPHVRFSVAWQRMHVTTIHPQQLKMAHVNLPPA